MRAKDKAEGIVDLATERAELRGHELGEWSMATADPGGLYFYEGLDVAFLAYCMRCGQQAWVDAKSSVSEPMMGAPALFGLCTGKWRIDHAPGYQDVLSQYQARPFIMYSGGVLDGRSCTGQDTLRGRRAYQGPERVLHR